MKKLQNLELTDSDTLDTKFYDSSIKSNRPAIHQNKYFEYKDEDL